MKGMYSPFNHQELFIKWTEMWHGDHTPDQMKELEMEEECEIYNVLQKEGYTFQELFDAVKEHDLDWEDSWGMYVSNSIGFIKQI